MEDINTQLCSLSEISKAQLAKILKSVEGSKDITLEPDIIRPLERVCGTSWLKMNGIEKIFKLEPRAAQLPNTQFYMIYSNIHTFKLLIELIQSQINLENPVHNKYHIICVPKYLYVFEEILESLGLYHTVVKLYTFQWLPIHLDTGIMSLELPGMYKSLYLQDDYLLLPSYAKSVWQLSHVFGRPKFVLTLGNCAEKISHQLNTVYSDPVDISPKFSGLIIMDRNVDYASALLTPRTYTALLKETYSVRSGVCEHKENNTDLLDDKYNPITKKQPVLFVLNSSKDGVYKNIKNRYFTEVTSILAALTKQLMTERESSKEMALNQIKTYVKIQLQAAMARKKNLTNHVHAAETIVSSHGHKFEKQTEVEENALNNKNKNANFGYLEEVLQTENDKLSSLSLMCLLAVTQNLSDSESKSFLNKYFLEFGYNYGVLYGNLIKAGFISGSVASISSKIKLPMLSSSNFYINANKLKQIPADSNKIDLKSPNCCSYVFGGCYIPLVAQIASLLLSATPLDDIRGKLGGFGSLQFTEGGYPLQKKSLLVYVVGGATYSEVAALNLLETLTGASIVVVSDKYISGRDIAEALITI